LHCVSGYPTPTGDSNLKTIPDLAERFDAVIGLSDHTLGVTVSVAGVALGAAVIEKHVTLARADGGPDAAFSLEPDELKELARGCRTAWEALGIAGFERKPSEESNAIFRRSLYVVEDIKANEAFTERNVRSIRPGYGLPPKRLKSILGKPAKRDIRRGTALTDDMVP
jgi:N-acetylneuraminate synthase